MPVLCSNAIFTTAPDTKDGGLFRLTMKGDGIQAQKAWTSPIDTCHGGVLYVNGLLHGSRYRRPGGWACLNPADGTIRYATKEIAMGSALYADGRLYCLSQKGTMALLEPGEKSYLFRGRFQFAVPRRKKDVWPHPVILNGRMYLRYHDHLSCYNIRE